MAIEQQRVQFVPFDFLKDVAVEGCDFYYVGHSRLKLGAFK